jgi:hypothetical protein
MSCSKRVLYKEVNCTEPSLFSKASLPEPTRARVEHLNVSPLFGQAPTITLKY